jgi:hypothetical protein
MGLISTPPVEASTPADNNLPTDQTTAVSESNNVEGGAVPEMTTAKLSSREAPPSPSQAEGDWKSSLPDDIKSDPSLGHITDVESLAKSYVHGQRMIGVDKIVPPNQYATDAEWNQVFGKLGLPEKIEDYAIQSPEGQEVNQEFLNGFKQIAHAAGVLPRQSQKLYDWYNQQAAAMAEKTDKEVQLQQQQEITNLKNEWGTAFESKLAAAQHAVKQFGGDEIIQYLEKEGLADDTKLVRLFAKIGESLGNDKILGLDGQPRSSETTPKDAQQEINKIFADKKGPYYDKAHPGHEKAVSDMAHFHNLLYPENK